MGRPYIEGQIIWCKSLNEETMKRWFSNKFLEGKELPIWKNMFERQPAKGYTGCSHAISGTDFYTSTSNTLANNRDSRLGRWFYATGFSTRNL